MISRIYRIRVDFECGKREYSYDESQEIDQDMMNLISSLGGEEIYSFFGNPAAGPYVCCECDDYKKSGNIEKQIRYFLYMHGFIVR